ncbi:phosphopantetheine-binding protein, partial [Streptomyces noursei]|uniref:phosphopantetheine-binding protein n=1 Tax=Streptomyces noursei TaxID=1971 RepID=UPI003316A056
YLIPATLTALPQLPLTPNGKLDPTHLPEPATEPDIPQGTDSSTETEPEVGPATATVESRLIAIWEALLQVPVRPGDNFFEIGGNSLLASRLRTALHEAGFTSVQLRDIYRNSSLPALATLVRAAGCGVKELS